MGLSAPVADRPYLESSSSVRNMWYEVQVLGRLGCLMRYTNKLAIGE